MGHNDLHNIVCGVLCHHLGSGALPGRDYRAGGSTEALRFFKSPQDMGLGGIKAGTDFGAILAFPSGGAGFVAKIVQRFASFDNLVKNFIAGFIGCFSHRICLSLGCRGCMWLCRVAWWWGGPWR
ncbi:hypothetical protein Mmc1_2534 [Magnetococcus marinus MC-1]|uniref:Uncharacterized protein n=1 Tax=Magnetococcus marinus (strain ATCC BAA-1437 / JCM 17883 / MC-1) TaxID=156889 RepID=A0LAP1_MAGMM|nr:hypothetical protein Mmc1_2534 [Magnetococcus marinus MC-1]